MLFFISVLIIILTAAGQVFLKLGADKSINSGFVNYYVVAGYFLFFVIIILSYYLMQLIPMKNFTVIMSLNYIAVMIAAKLFLNEEVNKETIIGTILVASGVIVFLL